MTFQLVLATDDEIIVWHTDHGHIYGFNVKGPDGSLHANWSKDIHDAPVRATMLAAEAQRFAEDEARARRLIR